MYRYFIIGTNTDCGKTYITCQLVDYLKRNHHHVHAIKPVASGCIDVDGVLVSEDVQRLNKHNSAESDESLFWRLKRPISPHLAAVEDGYQLSSQAIAKACQAFNADAIDILLIEGAGGLMVPLNEQETWVDFLIQTQIPVILVVGMQLGCINHALLTEAVLNMHGIECVGWIANCIVPDMLALPENIKTLSDKLSFPRIATVPFGGVITDVCQTLNFL